jgi:hypothetical protein
VAPQLELFVRMSHQSLAMVNRISHSPLPPLVTETHFPTLLFVLMAIKYCHQWKIFKIV